MFSKRVLKDKLKRILPERLVRPLRDLYLEHGSGYAVQSYSQEGEDLLVMSLLENRRDGFYVDVGAHHPKRFSNTQIFYESGWSGINIEPNPEALEKFRVHRKRDVNLCMGVGLEKGSMEYYVLDEPALNSFDQALTRERLSRGKCRLVETLEVQVLPLKEILQKWALKRSIDFLNVDAEGMDLEVLRSNDWNSFRPRVVAVELLESATEEIVSGDIYSFLSELGYRLIAKTQRTGLFMSAEEWRPVAPQLETVRDLP
ncbi:MAG: FkbM family methyltransferase [bacterium]|nr:FkbM family methyltransferase [bacterium]